MSFADLGVSDWLVRQCESLGLLKPTDVQQRCIPPIFKGSHVVGSALTGSGKTAAFALPMLQLLGDEVYGVFSLVMTPSRELAYQIVDQFVALGAPIGARTLIVIGGAHHSKQLEGIQGRPHIVVGTPGRLKMVLELFPEAHAAFKNLRFLVLDEADRLTEGDIQEDVFDVVKLLGVPKPFRQVLLMTATVNTRITNFEEGYLGRLGVSKEKLELCCDVPKEGESEITISPLLSEKYIFVPNMVKMPYLVALLKSQEAITQTIVFCNSCYRSEFVRLCLQLLGFPVTSLNSLLTQQQRLNNLALFKAGISKFLVCTDIAARGLDIPLVDFVVHYDFPKLSATYVHRIGRTARQGREGVAVAIVTENDVDLVHNIERRTKNRLKVFKHPKVNDEGVLQILDEVSAAKVQARVQVDEKFGSRTAKLKETAALKKPQINREIREDRRRGKRIRSD